MDALLNVLGIFVAVGATLAVSLAIAAVCLWGMAKFNRRAERSLANAYAGLQLQVEQRSGDVVVLYHTYHGVLVFVVTVPHYATLSYADARLLLNRLLWFNCTWGLFAWCGLVIPLIGAINYVLQRRSIGLQWETHQLNRAIADQPLPPSDANPYAASTTIATSRIPKPPPLEPRGAPSSILRLGGTILIGIAVLSLFGCLIAAVLGRSMEPLKAIAGVALIGAMGWGLWQHGR